MNHSLTSPLTYTHTFGLHLLHQARSHIKNSTAAQTLGFFVTFVAIQDSDFSTAPATVGLRTQTWSLGTAGAVRYLSGVQWPCCHQNHSLPEWPVLLLRAKPTANSRSGFLRLLPLGSLLMSMTIVTSEGNRNHER